MGVELDHVEALAARLLPDEHVHVVRPVLVQRQRIRQRLARRLQRERHVHVTHRISVNKPNKTPHNSLQLRIESCFMKAKVRELVMGAFLQCCASELAIVQRLWRVDEAQHQRHGAHINLVSHVQDIQELQRGLRAGSGAEKFILKTTVAIYYCDPAESIRGF